MTRFLLALLFVVVGGSAWGQCSTGNYPGCPGQVIYNGPLIVNPANPIQGNGSALTGINLPTISVSGVTANAALGSLPASAYINEMLCRETAGHAVNVSVGSTVSGSDVASAFSVPASGTTTATVQAFSKVWFSATAPQSLYLTPTGSGFSLNCNLAYQVGP